MINVSILMVTLVNLLIALGLVAMFTSSVLALKVLAVFYVLMKVSGYNKKMPLKRSWV